MSKLVRQNNTRRLARVVAKHDEADFGKVCRPLENSKRPRRG